MNSKNNSKNRYIPEETTKRLIYFGVAHEDIKKIAESISKTNLEYNECVWLLAEKQLCISKALEKSKKFGTDPKSITTFIVNPDKIIKNPSVNLIQKLAENIFQKGYSLQELHWMLAEKNIILDEIKV